MTFDCCTDENVVWSNVINCTVCFVIEFSLTDSLFDIIKSYLVYYKIFLKNLKKNFFFYSNILFL